jgi:hypothetical protein
LAWLRVVSDAVSVEKNRHTAITIDEAIIVE